MDSQGAIKLINNAQVHARTKHIDVLYIFVREAQAEAKISVTYVDTEHQLADALTKPLPRERFANIRHAPSMCAIDSGNVHDQTRIVCDDCNRTVHEKSYCTEGDEQPRGDL